MDDYRISMTLTEFEALSIHQDYLISSYWDPLIDANPKLMSEDFGNEAFLAIVTPGQRLFLLLGVFDGQVCNGGITQFFWNCQGTIFPVRDALEELGESDVLKRYEKALDALAGKQGRWQALRAEWARLAPGDEAWGSFRQSYELLDLDWFNQDYFNKWGYDAEGKWVMVREGLKEPFARRLVAFVKARPMDFITG